MWNLLNTYFVVGTVPHDVAGTEVVASASGSLTSQGCKDRDIPEDWWWLLKEGGSGWAYAAKQAEATPRDPAEGPLAFVNERGDGKEGEGPI